ncbi:hypothetical protein BDR06DRAFT_970805 [Suillus hirtellus]|nr:hypothetical protein BDR06DRAFT_970805 [Suillus hirtellus]
MAHVVNPVVQAMLASLDKARDPDEEDYSVPNKHLPFHYDPNDDADLHKLEQEQDSTIEHDDLELDKEAEKLLNEFYGLSPVKKLRETVKKIVSSPQRWSQFHTIAKEAFGNVKAPSGKLLCTLMTIEKWVFKRKELCDELYLSNQEWAFLKQLTDILEVFTKVTLYMSHSNTPTLPWAIPMYHGMETALQSASSDNAFVTQHSALNGFITLAMMDMLKLK